MLSSPAAFPGLRSTMASSSSFRVKLSSCWLLLFMVSAVSLLIVFDRPACLNCGLPLRSNWFATSLGVTAATRAGACLSVLSFLIVVHAFLLLCVILVDSIISLQRFDLSSAREDERVSPSCIVSSEKGSAL